MNAAKIAFTAEEIAALVQAGVTFYGLIQKVQAEAPDVWESVRTDFASAVTAWNAATNAPPPAVHPDIAAIVNASGTLPGMPTGPGEISLQLHGVEQITSEAPSTAAADAEKPTIYADASQMGVGQNVADHGNEGG